MMEDQRRNPRSPRRDGVLRWSRRESHSLLGGRPRAAGPMPLREVGANNGCAQLNSSSSPILPGRTRPTRASLTPTSYRVILGRTPPRFLPQFPPTQCERVRRERARTPSPQTPRQCPGRRTRRVRDAPSSPGVDPALTSAPSSTRNGIGRRARDRGRARGSGIHRGRPDRPRVRPCAGSRFRWLRISCA